MKTKHTSKSQAIRQNPTSMRMSAHRLRAQHHFTEPQPHAKIPLEHRAKACLYLLLGLLHFSHLFAACLYAGLALIESWPMWGMAIGRFTRS